MQRFLKVPCSIFLALLLSAALVFGLSPIAAYAENASTSTNTSTNSATSTVSTTSAAGNESSELTTPDPQQENSWRYEDGERLTSKDGAKTDEESTKDSASNENTSSSSGAISTFSITRNPNGYSVFNWFDKFSNGYYTGTNAYKGIDVSEHNGTIDWAKVKASGVDYAIIRCGYGQNMTSQDDSQWLNNVKGCIANGIPFGVYIYSYATTTARAESEAAHVLRLLSAAGLSPSKVGYPIYFDMEDDTTLNSDHAAIAKAFCNKISAAGYTPGIYATKYWFENYLTASCFNNWTKWVAQWNASSGLEYAGLSNFTSGNGMWQFSDYGTVPGINSKAVDLDYTFMKPGSATTGSNTTTTTNVANAKITKSGMMRNATGSALTPSITVTLGGKTLTKGTNYTVLYNGSETAPSAAGTYKVTIKGKGSYEGEQTVGTMTIYAKPSVSTSLSYKITSAANSSLVLDAAGATPKKGANVSIWSWNKGNNQQWYFAPDGNGYYLIKSAANTGYVLDAAGNSPSQGSNISVWTNKNDSSLNQKWILRESNGSYTFYNAANNNVVLDAAGASPKSGANVSAWTYKTSNNANQQWKLSTVTDVSVASVSASGLVRNTTGSALSPTITVKLGGKTLTKGTDYTVLYNGSETAPKTAGSYTVTIKGKGSYSGTKSVGTMRLVSPPALSSSKAYKIVSSYSASYVLDAAGTKPKKGANVSIWTWNNGSNQKWYFVPDGKGYYTIKSAANTGYVLDAAGTSPSQGSNVSVWTNKNDSSLNQKWVIESAGSGQYVFRNAANPNLVLDASGKKPKVGANVTTWTWNSGTNQKWKLTAL